MTLRELSRRPLTKILISVILLALVARFLNWRDLVDAASRLDPLSLTIGLVGSVFVLLFGAARWALMAAELAPGVFLRHARNYLFGIFIGIVTPANIGADLYRFGSFPEKEGAWPVVSLLLQEKVFILLGYFVALVLTLAAVPFAGIALAQNQKIALVAIGAAALLGTLGVFALHPLIGAAERSGIFSGRLASLLASARTVASLGGPRRWSALIGLSLMSVLAWLCAVSAIAASVGSTLPFLLLWLIAVLADVARWAPLSLQGIGVREAAFATMFAFFGASSAQGFVIGASAYLLLTAAMAISGALALGIDLAAAARGARRPKVAQEL